MFPVISWMIFSPLVGAFSLLFFGDNNQTQCKRIFFIAIVSSLISFLFSLVIFVNFQSSPKMQFVENLKWIESMGVSYRVGLDGISLPLILLTTFLTPIVLLFSWDDIKKRIRLYCFSMLLLETAMLGVFVSLDFFLFYVFWEAMLIPMYFIIGIWGGKKRIYSAMKFFLYTMSGSVLMLIAILWLYFATGVGTFNILVFLNSPVDPLIQTWLFVAFAIAFAIKVPMFPFHTWLPDAHVEAPTAGSVILAGVLLKMGTYGFIRLAIPLFPEAAIAFSPLFIFLSLVGIIYGGLMAMIQRDAKKLVAYSSVSHLGFVMFGLFSFNLLAVEGSVLQMVNHGICSGLLFLMVGMLYRRRHTRLIDDFGGIAKVMPVFSVFFVITVFSSIGLPGLNGFVGEFAILSGSFQSHVIPTIIATIGVVLSAVYMLPMVQKVIFGKIRIEANKILTDLNIREWFVLVPMIFLVFLLGIYPKPILKIIEPSTKSLLLKIKGRKLIAKEAKNMKPRIVLSSTTTRGNE